MESVLPYIIQIGELTGAAILGGWISRLLTIRSRVRQEQAGAGKAEAEAKASQIENIEALVEKVYKPTIETLTRKVEALQQRVDELEVENRTLREAVLNSQPAPTSSRSENARRRTRNANGQFVKEEGE